MADFVTACGLGTAEITSPLKRIVNCPEYPPLFNTVHLTISALRFEFNSAKWSALVSSDKLRITDSLSVFKGPVVFAGTVSDHCSSSSLFALDGHKMGKENMFISPPPALALQFCRSGRVIVCIVESSTRQARSVKIGEDTVVLDAVLVFSPAADD
jgi:hypothetical protein